MLDKIIMVNILQKLSRKYFNKKYLFWFVVLKIVSYIIIGLFLVSSITNKAEAVFNLDESVTLVKTVNQKQTYLLDHNRKIKKLYNSESVFLSYGNKFNQIKIINEQDLRKWPDAHLIKINGKTGVYYINGNQKTLIKSQADLISLGLSNADVINVNQTDLNSYHAVDYKSNNLLTYTNSAPKIKQKLYIYPTYNTLQDNKFLIGQKNIKLASFTVVVASDEDVIIDRIRLTKGTESRGDINFSNGFSNLRAAINDKQVKTIINQPNSNFFDFAGFDYALKHGEKAEITIIADTSNYLKLSQAQLMLSAIAVNDKEGGKQTILYKVNTNSEKVYFTPTIYSENIYNQADLNAIIQKNNYRPVVNNYNYYPPKPREPSRPESFSELSWPTAGRTINYYFNDTTYPYRNISEHNAIDIETGQGSSVRAVADGYVEIAEKTNSSSYSYVTIRHDNGIKTRYGHLSQIKVNVGDFIKRDQLIALSGGQPGTIGSGSYSTGPHLHFEVLVNGVNVDPLKYLE
ncbi:MAG: Peptidase, M23 family [Parcubacteria group bacterium GW2011_GWE2_38_18]|nr:MAG: Peptidase, M23 family [Parcubacteria group bacterium GW2011_GWE2_38_18]